MIAGQKPESLPVATHIDREAYAVSLITQGPWRFYTLTIPSRVLAQCCYVSNRFDDPEEGFQRRLDHKRALEIAAYIDSGLGTIPSAVILSAQPEANFVVTGRGKSVEFDVYKNAFLVLDGQHRVYGYSLAGTDLRVPVVIYSGLTREQEVKLFIDINTKQRPVPNELLLDIKRLASYEKPEERFLGELFDEFNTNPESVLAGWLSSAERIDGKLSRVTFNTGVKPALSRFTAHDVDAVFPTLNSFLAAVRQHLDELGVGQTLVDPTVFKALLDIFPRVARQVLGRKGREFDDSDFYEAVSSMFKSKRDFEKPGSSYKALSEKFGKKLDAEPLL
jgi:DGQHR domain-containing protein